MNSTLDQNEGLINRARLVLSCLDRQCKARRFSPGILFATLMPVVSGQIAY
jgi:hypothetical protein